jgi:hypothetical protein
MNISHKSSTSEIVEILKSKNGQQMIISSPFKYRGLEDSPVKFALHFDSTDVKVSFGFKKDASKPMQIKKYLLDREKCLFEELQTVFGIGWKKLVDQIYFDFSSDYESVFSLSIHFKYYEDLHKVLDVVLNHFLPMDMKLRKYEKIGNLFAYFNEIFEKRYIPQQLTSFSRIETYLLPEKASYGIGIDSHHSPDEYREFIAQDNYLFRNESDTIDQMKDGGIPLKFGRYGSIIGYYFPFHYFYPYKIMGHELWGQYTSKQATQELS